MLYEVSAVDNQAGQCCMRLVLYEVSAVDNQGGQCCMRSVL